MEEWHNQLLPCLPNLCAAMAWRLNASVPPNSWPHQSHLRLVRG